MSETKHQNDLEGIWIDCGNCDEGYVAHCDQEFACIDPESGCDYCRRKCDICHGKGGWYSTDSEDTK